MSFLRWNLPPDRNHLLGQSHHWVGYSHTCWGRGRVRLFWRNVIVKRVDISVLLRRNVVNNVPVVLIIFIVGIGAWWGDSFIIIIYSGWMPYNLKTLLILYRTTYSWSIIRIILFKKFLYIVIIFGGCRFFTYIRQLYSSSLWFQVWVLYLIYYR